MIKIFMGAMRKWRKYRRQSKRTIPSFCAETFGKNLSRITGERKEA